MSCARISVIIPTFHEAARLARTVDSARTAPNIEMIVVDASLGSETKRAAEQLGCQVISTQPGRAQQLNAGAERATGEILLFLHADTLLPKSFDEHVRATLGGSQVIAGAFQLRIDDVGWSLRLIEWATNLRSRSVGVPYGDQAIFLRKADFAAAGGFADLPIMEDYEFMYRLRRKGRIAIAPTCVVTSARRWQKLGPWRTTALNQCIILAYRLGVSPQRLARWYGARRKV